MKAKYHVLVIDDEADIREVICDVLEDNELNIKTYQAKDGVEGLTKIKNQQFDLVITDLKMPRMSGRDLLQEMKRIDKEFKPRAFIVASGHVEKEILKENPGGVSVIKKPFTMEDLTKYVKVVLTAKKKNPNQKKETLNVDFINPFIQASLEVLEVMCMTKAEKDFLFVKEDSSSLGDITGLIPISSPKHVGSMAISFPKEVYLKLVSEMLGEEFTEINDENSDGVGELCNQIFGNAKAALNKQDIFLDMTIPSVIRGAGHHVRHAVPNASVLGVYFKTEYGTFVVECVVANRKK